MKKVLFFSVVFLGMAITGVYALTDESIQHRRDLQGNMIYPQIAQDIRDNAASILQREQFTGQSEQRIKNTPSKINTGRRPASIETIDQEIRKGERFNQGLRRW